jgi:hypothetical protein
MWDVQINTARRRRKGKGRVGDGPHPTEVDYPVWVDEKGGCANDVVWFA